jgi:hypothetical protein
MADETELAIVPQFYAVAVNATEMAAAKGGIVTWLRNKLYSIEAEILHSTELLDRAVKYKLKQSAFKSQLQRQKQAKLYYGKLVAACEAGYTIVPNMPVDVFAIRVKRDGPAVKAALSTTTYKSDGATLADEQEQRLAIGDGRYESPVQRVTNERWETNDEKGNTKHNVLTTPVDFAEMEFPLAVAHPVVMDATAKAMALKIFDRIGIVSDRSGDPFVLGQITRKVGWQTKTASFLIAWYLDPRTL